MNSPDNLLDRARQRSKAQGLEYAGALSPREAHEFLKQNPTAKLVDVRTDAELAWVGYVPGAVHIEWNSWPEGHQNASFIEQLRATIPSNDAPVLFLCRSGARSHKAAEAATEAGYTQCFNILEGFEGDRDASMHRSSVCGWRFAGLPWAQN
jgi:rhodanese-related sulfurtransferase